MEAIMAAAKISGADAIHPGYGFLSENPALPEACQKNGIVFIGPDAKSMKMLGHKSIARNLAVKSKIPVSPGSKGCVEKGFAKEAEKIGYPIMIKAAAAKA